MPEERDQKGGNQNRKFYEFDPRMLSRYRQLVERSAFDLKLAHDAAVAIGLPIKRLSRVRRAWREVKDELAELERNTQNGKGRNKVSGEKITEDLGPPPDNPSEATIRKFFMSGKSSDELERQADVFDEQNLGLLARAAREAARRLKEGNPKSSTSKG